METLELFAPEPAQEAATATHPIHFLTEEPDVRARRRITALMESRHVCVLAFSSGKDSSALVSLVLLSAVELKMRGGTPPPIIITHSSTGVENPIVSRIAHGELRKMREFAVRHGLDVRTMVGEHPAQAAGLSKKGCTARRKTPTWAPNKRLLKSLKLCSARNSSVPPLRAKATVNGNE